MLKLVANNKLIDSTTEIGVEEVEGGEEEETDGITTKETKVRVITATTFVINIQIKVRGEANTKVTEGVIVTMIIEVVATLTHRATMTEGKWARETEGEAVTNIQEEVEEVEEGEEEDVEAVKIEVVLVTVILVSGATLHTMMLLNGLVATPVHNQVPQHSNNILPLLPNSKWHNNLIQILHPLYLQTSQTNNNFMEAAKITISTMALISK